METTMPPTLHDTSTSVRTRLSMPRRSGQNKKSDPADLQQVLLLIAALNRISLSAE